MKRRDFLTAATGVAGGATAASTAAAGGSSSAARSSIDDRSVLPQQDNEDDDSDDDGEEEAAGDDLPGAGQTETVIVGPGGDLVYDPDELVILPGTTVRFIWESDNHNLNVQSGPEGGWDGYDDLEDTGFEYEHTFEVEGEYEYVCDPHIAAGMEAVIIVTDDPDAVGADEQEIDFDPAHDLGVPLQKHFIGAATFAAIFVTLVFTFYVLKYGESSHSSSPNRK